MAGSGWVEREEQNQSLLRVEARGLPGARGCYWLQTPGGWVAPRIQRAQKGWFPRAGGI